MTDADAIVAEIVRLSAKLQALQGDVVRVSGEREGLVRELQAEGWSLGRIAKATGLSRARIQQIAG